jgi:molecular chaperone HtpG
VAEEVRVASRSYKPGAEAVEWVSDGGSRYRVAPADKASRGTRIEIKLKEDAADFASTWRLEQIVKKHSDFVQFPIYIGDKKEPVNRQTAPWRRPPREVTEEEYNEFYKHLTLDFEKPLLVAHLVTDAPANVRSILYVPARRERGALSARTDYGLQLYVRNVLIQQYNKDLLPNHWRFVEGVVESEDLPLNISRETVQSSQAARRIQRALVRKLVKELETMAEERPEDYATFWREFGPFVKEGVASDPSSHADLLPLLRFHSSRDDGELVSLHQYVERMGQDQGAIYYLLGEDRRSVARSPHLDYFRAHDLEVLYLVDPIDSFMTMAFREFEGKPLKNVDDAGLELDGMEEQAVDGAVAEADFNRLVGRFVKVLNERVLEVRESRVLKDSPCRLVSAEDAPAREMSRVYRLLGQEYEVPRRILELNRSHPILANLARLVAEAPENPVIDDSIELLFESQLLMEGLHPNPTDLIPRLQQLMQVATAQH